ncbi:MAG: HEAT repeat domain-containing protein [Spirochaetia bacterium]|jgi:HEAT repeat protein
MKILAAVLALLAACPYTLTAADTGALAERTRQTLLYGIDSQVLDVIQSLKAGNDSGFTRELSEILSGQRSAAVRKAVLELFLEQKVREGEGTAREILTGWQAAPSDLLVAAIRYLAFTGGAGLADALTPLVDATDAAAASAAIEALGRTGNAAAAALLVARLKSTDFPDARKSTVILALGELKDSQAVDALMAIAQSQDEDKVRRMYAADALGKIGDPRALPVLKAMYDEPDALIRLYAASALARYGLDSVFPILIQALRDENWKVREQSARSLARPLSSSQAAAAVPILMYKAESDPISQVRIASIQALGEIGGDAPMKALVAIYAGSDHPLESREAALNIVAKKSLSSSLDAVRSVINDEWKSYDQRALESTAKVLSTVNAAELKDIFVHFLESPDAAVRSYGCRGIAENHFSDLRERLRLISEKDPNPGTRKEAELSLARL